MIDFEIERCTVKAKNRKLNARWSIDIETDIVNCHGLFGEDDNTRYEKWKCIFLNEDKGFFDYVKNVKPTVDKLREL